VGVDEATKLSMEIFGWECVWGFVKGNSCTLVVKHNELLFFLTGVCEVVFTESGDTDAELKAPDLKHSGHLFVICLDASMIWVLDAFQLKILMVF